MTIDPKDTSADALPEAVRACGEDERALVLTRHNVDSLEDDDDLTRIVCFASELCKTQMSLVTVVERELQVSLARYGTDERELPRSTSFCAHTMLGDEVMVVEDATKDARFADFSIVTGPENVRFYAGAPLVADDGTPIGALCVIDIVPRPEGLSELQTEGLTVLAAAVMQRLRQNREQLEAKSEAEHNEARLRTVIDSVPQIAWSSDSEGRFDYFNARWKEVTGEDPPAFAEQWEPFVHPDDFEAIMEGWIAKFVAGEPFEGEYRIRHRGGTYRWVLVTAVPALHENTQATRWYGTITDIDDTHRQSEGRDLLARELSHRIKNIFAVVSGLIALSSRGRPEVGDFSEELTGKIHALGRAHDFVRPIDSAKGESLYGLLGVLMAPYVTAGDARVDLQGEDIKIGVRAATPLALVFHEFATNAAKYGALSVTEGRVAVSVARAGDDAIIEWRETDGPPPGEIDRVGFGSRLVEMTVSSQLRGEILREMEPAGFVAKLTIPISSL